MRHRLKRVDVIGSTKSLLPSRDPAVAAFQTELARSGFAGSFDEPLGDEVRIDLRDRLHVEVDVDTWYRINRVTGNYIADCVTYRAAPSVASYKPSLEKIHASALQLAELYNSMKKSAPTVTRYLDEIGVGRKISALNSCQTSLRIFIDRCEKGPVVSEAPPWSAWVFELCDAYENMHLSNEESVGKSSSKASAEFISLVLRLEEALPKYFAKDYSPAAKPRNKKIVARNTINRGTAPEKRFEAYRKAIQRALDSPRRLAWHFVKLEDRTWENYLNRYTRNS